MKNLNRIVFWTLAAAIAVRALIAWAAPLVDPSEARYAVLAANMAASGDFIQPMFHHNGLLQVFDGKPPLYFQLGGLFCKMFGQNEFAVRLPSLLAMVGILLLVAFAVRAFGFSRERGLLAVALTLFSGAFYFMSGLAVTDILLTFSVTGAVAMFAVFARSGKRRHSVLFFFFLAVGMITKGPVALVLAGLPLFVWTAYRRAWRGLRNHAWFSGTLLFLAVTLPWFVLIERVHPGALRYFFINENFLRFVTPDYGDKFGAGREFFRGASWVWLAVAALPWTPAAAVVAGRRRGLIFKDGGLSALAAVTVFAITTFWTLTSRVPFLYIFPALPWVAVFIAVEAKRVDTWLKAVPVVAAVVVAGSAVFAAGGVATSSKAAGRFFQRLAAEHPDARFYFARHTPYSAEFYLRDRVVHHPREKTRESVVNCGAALLVAREHDAEESPALHTRAPLCEGNGWRVFAPERAVRKGDSHDDDEH